MVGPGALKPSDGDGIESRRPLLLSLLCSLYSSHSLIFAPILVCIIIIIIIITNTYMHERSSSNALRRRSDSAVTSLRRRYAMALRHALLLYWHDGAQCGIAPLAATVPYAHVYAHATQRAMQPLRAHNILARHPRARSARGRSAYIPPYHDKGVL